MDEGAGRFRAREEGTRPHTAEGGGGGGSIGVRTRPATAEGVREAAEGVGRAARLGLAGQVGEEEELSRALAELSRALAEGRLLRARLAEVQEQNERLRAVVAEMRTAMEKMSADRAGGGGGAGGRGAQGDAAALAERLRQTEAVLRRVTDERDKLIAISNRLRADLLRAQVS